MSFPKRKCCVLLKKLFVVFIVACVYVCLLNVLCLDGKCDHYERDGSAFLSLNDVLQANKHATGDDRRKGFYENAFSSFSLPDKKESDNHHKELNVTAKLQSLQLNLLDFCPPQSKYEKNQTIIGRREFGSKRFLSVGIPSITRKRKSYLEKTLISLMEAIANDEKNNVTVVVFLADFDSEMKQQQLKQLREKFAKYISIGLLQIIQASFEYYEPLRDLHRSLGDHMDRVLWRSKQALDYVYLMCYCSYISDYYLQLEDDIITSPRFVSKIADFIHSQKSNWISLNVALLGYIGKLYPGAELQNLASYLRLFFDEMPVDWLEPRWKKYRGQDPAKTTCRAASLFQHVGLISSFRPKESQRPNTLKEKIFDRFDHKYAGLNPPAEIWSDLTPVKGVPMDAYNKGDGFFHARFTSAGSKMYTIFLKKEVKLARIVVETGANFAPHDAIVAATLEISSVVVRSTICKKYESVREFSFGRIDVLLDGRKARCVRVRILYQGRWIFFREVDIWTQ